MSSDEQRSPGSEYELLAALDREMKRIAALPSTTAEQRLAMVTTLESFRDDQRRATEARVDAPEWRRVLDAGVTRALDGLIDEMKTPQLASGGLALDPMMLQRHLEPVFNDITAALQKSLVDKFGRPTPPGAPPPKVDATDVVAMLATLFGPPGKKK